MGGVASIAVRKSYPRFRRASEAPKVALSDDDVTILRHLRRHRFLKSTDLYDLMPHRSADKVSRRLVRLYRAGFLDRPLSQIEAFRSTGSQPLVYGLDNAGTAYLAALDGGRGDADIRGRNRRYRRENLDHTLATARFLVDVELSCRREAHLEYVPGEQIRKANADQKFRPARWPVAVPWHGRTAQVIVAPDAVFGLRRPQTDGRTLRSYYLVEIDRGSMTIAPADRVRRSEAFLYRASVLRKLLAYAVSHKEQSHQRHFEISAARVLFLTTNQKRAEEMRRTARDLVLRHLDLPDGLFLFGAIGTGDPLTFPLTTAGGELVALAPAGIRAP